MNCFFSLRSHQCYRVLLAIVFSGFVTLPGQAAEPSHQHGSAEAHHHPAGWRFTMPKGNPAKGREVFIKYDCYFCHEVRGEGFENLPFAGSDYGPELSQMGPMHPLEYFMESIINPSAWVEKGYRGPDGKSTMPSYNDRMTVQELIDVSTYLALLKPKSMSKSVSAEGKVVAVVSESNQIVLEHGEIKGFMDPMTMGYKVSTPSLLKAAKPGDKVQFTIDAEKLVITKITKLNK